MFDRFVIWVSQSDFYTKYVSMWPAPLNNVSFDAFIIVCFLIYGIWQVCSYIQSIRFHRRLRKKQRIEDKKASKKIDKEPETDYIPKESPLKPQIAPEKEIIENVTVHITEEENEAILELIDEEEEPEDTTQIPIVEIDDLEEDEPYYDEISYRPLVNKKAKENKGKNDESDTKDQFTKVLESIKAQKEERSQLLKENEELEITKANNLNLLDKKIQSSFRVEGEENKKQKTKSISEEKEFNMRKKQALALEEKERKKGSKR